MRKNAVRDAECRLLELQQSVDAAAIAMEAWRQDWSKAVVALGLPEDTSIDTAEAALEAWARISEAGPAWRTDEASHRGDERQHRSVHGPTSVPWSLTLAMLQLTKWRR